VVIVASEQPLFVEPARRARCRKHPSTQREPLLGKGDERRHMRVVRRGRFRAQASYQAPQPLQCRISSLILSRALTL